MERFARLFCAAVGVVSMASQVSANDGGQSADPRKYLEEIQGERALAWVRSQNERSVAELEGDARFAEIKSRLLELVTDAERIPSPHLTRRAVYNTWTDQIHTRGLLRRTSLEGYLKASDIAWEPVLDVDRLAERESENWYLSTYSLSPSEKRALIYLNRGGKDAAVLREFDLEKKEFVASGFELPEAKGGATWVDEDTLLVGTNFGEGSLSPSGYPLILKLWRRGTPLAEAREIFRAQPTDLGAWSWIDESRENQRRIFLSRTIDFYNQQHFLWDVQAGTARPLPIPSDASFLGVFKERAVVLLKSDLWVNGSLFERGSLISLDLALLIRGEIRPMLIVASRPDAIVAGATLLNEKILVTLTEHVVRRVWEFVPTNEGQFATRRLPLPEFATSGLYTYETHYGEEKAGRAILFATSHLRPTQIFFYDEPTGEVTLIRTGKSYYDASPYRVEQHFATSTDGTRVPYFQISREDLPMTGQNPTWIYGYGGFSVSLTPSYLVGVEQFWLRPGGVYVVANIRGGGEYGPAWHQAALKENRQKAFDDFYAVTEDLIRRGVTSPGRIGIEGGSNGGLLTGVATTQRPELYAAAVISVPLLDMLGFHKLLAGYSWVGEYGDPEDPAMRDVLRAYSPYHNLRADRIYPRVFLTTSTLDDRVHPGHARKFGHLMEELGHPFLYFENTEGGHAGAVSPEQTARVAAYRYIYMLRQLFGATGPTGANGQRP